MKTEVYARHHGNGKNLPKKEVILEKEEIYIANPVTFPAHSPVSFCITLLKSSNPNSCPQPLRKEENIYDTQCPILYAMDLIGQKWKLPILWYVADAENQTLRYKELERKVVGITATMLTKCLRELERDGFITRKQYNTIPPTVEYSLAE